MRFSLGLIYLMISMWFWFWAGMKIEIEVFHWWSWPFICTAIIFILGGIHIITHYGKEK
jgi:hypothetical protein